MKRLYSKKKIAKGPNLSPFAVPFGPDDYGRFGLQEWRGFRPTPKDDRNEYAEEILKTLRGALKAGRYETV